MFSVTSLVIGLVLASTVFAVPSSHMSRSPKGYQSRHKSRLQRVNNAVSHSSSVDPIWAGAVQSKAKGTFSSVTGTFTVPIPSGASGSSATVWVGIDGYECKNGLLQTGIDFSVVNGTIGYDAWYEWFPEISVTFNNITFSAGNAVRLTVTAYSATSGNAEIENMTNGQKVFKNLTSNSPLCQQSAEWIVEDYLLDSALVSLANFGTITFTNATATMPNGTLTPDGADIVNIGRNNQTLTSVSIHESNVIIEYV